MTKPALKSPYYFHYYGSFFLLQSSGFGSIKGAIEGSNTLLLPVVMAVPKVPQMTISFVDWNCFWCNMWRRSEKRFWTLSHESQRLIWMMEKSLHKKTCQGMA